MVNRILPIVFAVYPLFLAGIAIMWPFIVRHRSWPNWAMVVLACGSIIAFVFMTGPWVFTSYYLRYVLLGLFVVSTVFSYWRMKRGISGAVSHGGRVTIFSTGTLLLFTLLDALTLVSRYPPEETLDISFPLASGSYYVLQGGNSVVTNPFHALSGSKQALDIVKLNSFANRANGIAPRALSEYETFGDKLHSPCEGNVLKIRDSLPDTLPGNPDTEHPEGNYITLKCAEVEILMAHLMRGSIKVRAGDAVATGQFVAEIGNSGNSLEPHLHIGAKQNGVEIGLRFNKRYLSVNSVVTSR